MPTPIVPMSLYVNPTDNAVEAVIHETPMGAPVVYRAEPGEVISGPTNYASVFKRLARLELAPAGSVVGKRVAAPAPQVAPSVPPAKDAAVSSPSSEGEAPTIIGGDEGTKSRKPGKG